MPDAASREFFGDNVQARAYDMALEQLAALGGTIVEIDFTPFYEIARMLYEGAWVAERLTVVEALMREQPEALHPVTRQIIAGAEGLSAADAFRGLYRLAELKRAVEPLLDAHRPALRADDPDLLQPRRSGTLIRSGRTRGSAPIPISSICSICAGWRCRPAPRSDGRPGSVTLLAARARDGLLAGIGAALQVAGGAALGATGAACPAPPMPIPGPAPGPMADETVIAAVGAHMSGLPLNGELTRRGARFLAEVATAPAYRLYALAGGSPARPGLLRVGQGGGAVALELWALPRAEMGGFLAGIPSPLGLGTVVLADGRSVTGFLVEAAATGGAEDITALGGWRAYLASC